MPPGSRSLPLPSRSPASDTVCALRPPSITVSYSAALDQLNAGTHPATLVSILNNRAISRLRTQDYDLCVADCDAILRVDALNFRALIRRGQAYESLEKLDPALADFRRAREISPQDKQASDGMNRVQRAQAMLNKRRSSPEASRSASASSSSASLATPAAAAAAPAAVSAPAPTLSSAGFDLSEFDTLGSAPSAGPASTAAPTAFASSASTAPVIPVTAAEVESSDGVSSLHRNGSCFSPSPSLSLSLSFSRSSCSTLSALACQVAVSLTSRLSLPPLSHSLPPSNTHASIALKRMRAAEEQAAQNSAEADAALPRVQATLSAWKDPRVGNIRALLSSAHTVVPASIEFTAISLADLMTPAQIKRSYMRAIASVHPDKVHNADTADKLLAQGVFHALNEAYNAFRDQQ